MTPKLQLALAGRQSSQPYTRDDFHEGRVNGAKRVIAATRSTLGSPNFAGHAVLAIRRNVEAVLSAPNDKNAYSKETEAGRRAFFAKVSKVLEQGEQAQKDAYSIVNDVLQLVQEVADKTSSLAA